MKLLYYDVEVELESVLQRLSDLNESTGLNAARPVTSFYFHYPLLQLLKLITNKLLIG
jgi:hypothetical protein